MELLEQCQIWNENNEYRKIIDALEAVPAGERTPEMDSELAGPITISPVGGAGAVLEGHSSSGASRGVF